MTPNSEFFNQIEEYCLGQLDKDLKFGFESELRINPLLRSEMELWKEIQSAIREKEILTLRNKLQNVTQMQKTASVSSCDSFEFLEDFSEIQEITDVLSTEELMKFYDSLPKVHVYHHISNSNENIHQFYKNQKESVSNWSSDAEDDLSDFDLENFEGLEQAILEKDILHFRQTLKQVAKSVEPQFTVEEIDEYINGELTGAKLIEFEKDIFQNRSLRNEVKLQHEIDSAIGENDIIQLRNQISNILQTETSWNVSEKSIEDFIDGTLEGELLDEFLFEMKDNADLKAEVELRKQVNESIIESDIFNLRSKLKEARETAEVKKVKMLIPQSKIGEIRFWRNSVAIVIVLLGIGGVLRNSFMSYDRIYDKFFEAPEWSPERSLSDEITVLQRANFYYLNGDDYQVINILSQANKSDINYPVFDFYTAVSFQRLEKLEEAIANYTKVINHGDNLFIEESEWFRSLCYLNSGDKKMARTELLAIIQRKGHFENEAKAVFRRLKYSVK
jgi:tetratricopeptide (TPR) repeat protein